MKWSKTFTKFLESQILFYTKKTNISSYIWKIYTFHFFSSYTKICFDFVWKYLTFFWSTKCSSCFFFIIFDMYKKINNQWMNLQPNIKEKITKIIIAFFCAMSSSFFFLFVFYFGLNPSKNLTERKRRTNKNKCWKSLLFFKTKIKKETKLKFTQNWTIFFFTNFWNFVEM